MMKPKERAAMQQALEMMDAGSYIPAMRVLREALAKPKKQEECAKGCPPLQVCDYCQKAEQADEIDWIETNKALAREIIELQKQAEQEPVAWYSDKGGFNECGEGQPLYAAPVSIAKQSETDSSSSSMRTTVRTKDLTDDEIERALDAAKVPELPDGYKSVDLEIARAVIAADRELNK